MENKKAQIEAIIIMVVFMVMFLTILFIIGLATMEDNSLNKACKNLGYDNYFQYQDNDYCSYNGKLISIIKYCTRRECVIALKNGKI
jgi:hypothetical protein